MMMYSKEKIHIEPPLINRLIQLHYEAIMTIMDTSISVYRGVLVTSLIPDEPLFDGPGCNYSILF